MNLIGYVRLSKGKEKGHSLDSQQSLIQEWAKENGHRLLCVVGEVGSARDPKNLNGRRLAIAAIKGGMAEAIVVRDLDRVTRSLADGAGLLKDATVNHWRLLGVDGLDTDDPEQEFTRHIKMAVAEEERRMIAKRTERALRTARRNGTKIGKPRQIRPDLERRIVRLAKKGASPYAIGKRLDAEGIPTAQGGKSWSPSVIREVIKRNGAEAAA
jgi:DNA invertase Pin-like site-specific DNA recombinase